MTLPRDDLHSPDRLSNARETAAILGISERTLWKLTRPRGPIPCIRLGSCIRYSARQVDEWIQSQSQGEISDD